MSCQAIQELLSGHVDGELSPEEAGRVRRHLETCEGCREVADDLAALRDAAAGLGDLLRQEMEDADAGWDALAEELGAGQQKASEPVAQRAEHRAARSAWPYVALAAAAAVTALVIGPTLLEPRDELDSARKVATAELRLLDHQQRRAIRALDALVGKQKDHWTPKMRRLFSRNARVIDAALGECRRAVRQKPADPELRASLAAAYERKVEFLRIFSGLEETP